MCVCVCLLLLMMLTETPIVSFVCVSVVGVRGAGRVGGVSCVHKAS